MKHISIVIPRNKFSFLTHINTFCHFHSCLLYTSDFPSAFWTVRNSHSCIEKTKIVVNLRNRPYCGTRISVCRFLVNGNGRRKTFYTLHVRLLHLSQELPCIRGKRFHIASLSPVSYTHLFSLETGAADFGAAAFFPSS